MPAPADVRAFVSERNLNVRSSSRAGGRTAVIVALYATVTAAGLMAEAPLVTVAAVVAQGCILVGAFSAMHEAAHGVLFQGQVVNRVACLGWGSAILLNASLWRCFHLVHHARTGAHDDPEQRYKVEVVHRRQYLLLPAGGLQFIGQLWLESVGTLFGRFPSYVRQGANKRAIQLNAALLLVLTIAIAAAFVLRPMVLLQLWGGAFLVVACALLPLTAVNEHHGCDAEGEAFDTTRTVISNRVVRFLLWNTNYHVEHHLLASVPYHRLHALHEYVRPRERFVARSYTAFHLEVLRGCGARRAGALPADDRP